VADPTDQPATTRDRKDDYLVALARNEGVDAIVSGDHDLSTPSWRHRWCGRRANWSTNSLHVEVGSSTEPEQT
jgi:predicted nucleic acid-binding protein